MYTVYILFDTIHTYNTHTITKLRCSIIFILNKILGRYFEVNQLFYFFIVFLKYLYGL